MRAVLRSFVLGFGLLVAASNASAEAPTTPQIAAQQVRPKATQLLTDAQRSATELRTRAANPDAVRAAATKQVRHEIATQIVGARKNLHQNSAALRTAQAEHAAGTAKVATTEAELTSAQAHLATSKAAVPGLVRFLGFSFTEAGRAKLGRYQEAKAAYELLGGRLQDEKHHVAEMAADVKRFETKRVELAKNVSTQRGRDWKSESTSATASQLQSLTAEADHVEASAKKEIHTLVSSFVASKYSLHRLPVAQAHAQSENALAAADHADSHISSANSALSDLSSALVSHQTNATMEAAFGENDLTKALGTLNHLNVNTSASTAQSRLQSVNHAVGALNERVASLKAMTAGLKVGAAGLEGQAARVDTDVATVAMVDLVLGLTNLDSPLMDISMGLMEQSQVSSASSALARTRSNVAEIRANVRQVHAKLGAHLREMDAEAAKVVDQAVAELTADAPKMAAR